MSTKAVLIRRVSVERRVTVAIPNGLPLHYLVAALNAESANEVGEFLICPDTFSVRVEGNETEYSKVRWDVLSAEEQSITEGGDSSADALRAAAKIDAEQAEEAQRQREVVWRLDSLTQMALVRVIEGKYNEARSLTTAASLLYQLSGEGDSGEAVWLYQLKSLNAAFAKKSRAAWRHGKLAIAMARRLHQPTSTLLGLCLANVGEGLLTAGDLVRAEVLLLEAVKVLDEAAAASPDNASLTAGAKAESLANLQKIEDQKSYTQ